MKDHITDELDDVDGELYMEMCAALISMTDSNEVFIPQRVFPMHGFSILRRQEDGGFRVRLIYDDAENDPRGKPS